MIYPEMEFDNLKKFVGIEYLDETNDVVPKKWMTSIKRVYIPPDNLRMLAKISSPLEDNWRSYTVKILADSSKAIHIARCLCIIIWFKRNYFQVIFFLWKYTINIPRQSNIVKTILNISGTFSGCEGKIYHGQSTGTDGSTGTPPPSVVSTVQSTRAIEISPLLVPTTQSTVPLGGNDTVLAKLTRLVESITH